jgi:biofilm PGA synthesis protein PgaD
MSSFIIENPEWQTLRQRTLYGTITLTCWVFWVYLWAPLLSFLAWVLGLSTAYEHMVVLRGYQGVLRLFGLYLLVIGIMGGSLLIWAFYNFFRFRGVERRQHRPMVTINQLAGFHGLEALQLEEWQHSKRLVIHHDAQGKITGVEQGWEKRESQDSQTVPSDTLVPA